MLQAGEVACELRATPLLRKAVAPSAMWQGPDMHLKVVEGLVRTRDPVEGLGSEQDEDVCSSAGLFPG